MLNWIRNIDIRKVAYAVGIMTLVEQGIVSGDAPLTGLMSAAALAWLMAWCKLLIWVNGFILIGHTATAVRWSTPAAPGGFNAAAKALVLFLATSAGIWLVSPQAANAQTVPPLAKAFQALPSNPCLATNCTGIYGGGFFGGLGNNVNVLGNGISGSFNSGGMMPGGDLGWQYFDGKFLIGLELDFGYQFASNTALPGAVGSFNGPFGIIQAKTGASMAQLSPSFTIPNLPLTVMTPYLAGGEMMQRHGGTGGVGGGGVLFTLGTNGSNFLDVEYLNGGGAGGSGNATASNNNIFLVKLQHLF